MKKQDKLGRNDPCPCGSGQKYKKCHLDAVSVTPPGDIVSDSTSRDKIKEYVNRFPALCKEMGIHLGKGNAVDMRFHAAKQFCATESHLKDEDNGLLVLVSEFRSLFPCLESFKEQLKQEDHLYRLIHRKTFSHKFLELRTAYFVKQVGFDSKLGEPDVIAKVAGESVGLACKSVCSVDTIPAQISDGRDQIIKAKMPGIVVIDISNIQEFSLKPHYHRREEMFEELKQNTHRISEEAQRKIPRKLASTEAQSVLFINSHSTGIVSSADHVKKTFNCLPYYASYLFFFSKNTRHPALATLENAIIGSNTDQMF